jgi:TonB family protein
MAMSGVPTANDRLKESFAARVWLSLIVATFIHVLPFRFWPEMEAQRWGPVVADVIETVQLPPVDLPAKPPELSGPLRPALATDPVVVETYDPVLWHEVVDQPLPPPVRPVTGSRDGVPFTPHTVAPRLANPDRVQRVLQREYPPNLRDASLGGTVDLLVHVSMDGRVTEIRVGKSSGMTYLDEAALRVAEVMRIEAAMNRDHEVAVWTRLPVTFRVR